MCYWSPPVMGGIPTMAIHHLPVWMATALIQGGIVQDRVNGRGSLSPPPKGNIDDDDTSDEPQNALPTLDVGTVNVANNVCKKRPRSPVDYRK